MRIDEDPLITLAGQLAVSETTAVDVAHVVAKTVLSMVVPLGIGAAVTNVLTDLAQARWKERVSELLMEFAERVALLEDEIEDPSYYSSEEFQALLLDAIEQEKTNRYKEKRQILANGLANSGTRTWQGLDEKEVFFRVLRDITPSELRVLNQFSLDEDLAPYKALQPTATRLEGLGLLYSSTRWALGADMSIQSSLTATGLSYEFLSEIPRYLERGYRLTSFGTSFKGFLLEKGPARKRPS